MTDIEWACRWVGKGWNPISPAVNDDPLIAENTEDGYLKTMADLAEAVRVKFIETDQDARDYDDAAHSWLNDGSEAFIAAVREAVGDD